MDTSVPAVKAALHRGRARLASWRRSPRSSVARVGRARALAPRRLCRAVQCARLRRHTRHARRRGAAGARQRTRMHGRSEVGRYFHNYDRIRGLASCVRRWSTGVRRSWCAIPAIRRAACLFRSPAVGRNKLLRIRDFATRATPWTAPSSRCPVDRGAWAHPFDERCARCTREAQKL